MNTYKEPMQDSIPDNSTITQPTTLIQTTPQITPETTSQDHSRLFLIIEMFQKLKILITGFDDLLDIEIPRTHFLQPSLVNDFLQFIPRLKKIYKSSKLTCLHKNSASKQKFIIINMLRQVLKCNNIRMKSKSYFVGYDPKTGKRLAERKYCFIPMENN